MKPGRPVMLPWQERDGLRCFGCSPNNPYGLKLQLVETVDGLSCTFTPQAEHQSYPGMTHGGITAALLDEMMGNLIAVRAHKLCVAVSLHVRFLAPVRTGNNYEVNAALADRPPETHSYYKAKAWIADVNGVVLAEATGFYSWVSREMAGNVAGSNVELLSSYEPYLGDG
jgi:acyl-coenzyme A thioesterase PaaI-like protein